MRTKQDRLPLEIGPGDWRLDEHTKEIGRRGLAEARAALAEASRRVEQREAQRRDIERGQAHAA
jgi:hypothetical protein